MANRLGLESSPYLLQHKDNPVDWYPWGDEAFERAKEVNQPIFLSIGYSTCHWCHVMEHESFEDEDVALLMNQYFVSIKVDREERPDIDNIYMSVCQLVGGQCGWPLNVVLTPDGKPFFVGTYFPKTSRGGRIGFTDLLTRIAEAWSSDRVRVEESANNITEAVAGLSQIEPGELDEKWSELAIEQFSSSFDRVGGGFGSRPKFPSPHNLLFMMRSASPLSSSTLNMVTTTLDRMATGGFHDHVGGGFHRYSTDGEWRLPHFEKMLYDQAMLILAYTEAWQITGYARYREIAEKCIAYVLRDLQDSNGSFYSAEDADSEGVEGKFYVWTLDEFAGIVEQHDIIEKFGIRKEGNFEDEATHQYTGENVLHMTKPNVVFQADDLLYDHETRSDLARLLNVRSTRVRPGRDGKILTDWNGLMIAALASAGRIFGNEEYVRAAEGAANNMFGSILEHGELQHARAGSKVIHGFLDDYSFLLWGIIELYQAQLSVPWLQRAVDLAAGMHDRFIDEQSGGLFLTPDGAHDLIVRPLDFSDGALPSGNAIASYNYHRIFRLTGDTKWEDRSMHILNASAVNVSRYPSAFGAMVLAADYHNGPGREIVVTGPRADPFVVKALELLNNSFSPRSVVHLVDFSESDQVTALGKLVDYTSILVGGSEEPAVYICDNFACSLPIRGIDTLKAHL